MKNYLLSVLEVIALLISVLCWLTFFVGGVMLLTGGDAPLWPVIISGVVTIAELAYVFYKT